MSWHLGTFYAYDCETTGVSVEDDRIVTATLVKITGSEVETRDWLIDPGVPISPEATAMHGITDEQARAEGEDPTIACAQILACLDEAWTGGRPVVIYNASFDISILDRELRRHCNTHIADVTGPIIDPFVIDKALDPYRRGKRTLTACCEHYGVKLEDAHTSAGDALAAARLAWRLAQVYPGELADLALVNEKQAEWRARWAAQFEDFLRREGKLTEPVDPHWPLRPFIGVPA